jgi:hypothetical protein
MNDMTIQCMETATSSQFCVRFVPTGAPSMSFPYGHLIDMTYNHSATDEMLVITFASHSVVIAGARLDLLQEGLENFAVKIVRDCGANDRYVAFAAKDKPLVKSISFSKSDE